MADTYGCDQSKILPNTTHACKIPNHYKPYNPQSPKPHNQQMAIVAGL